MHFNLKGSHFKCMIVIKFHSVCHYCSLCCKQSNEIGVNVVYKKSPITEIHTQGYDRLKWVTKCCYCSWNISCHHLKLWQGRGSLWSFSVLFQGFEARLLYSIFTHILPSFIFLLLFLLPLIRTVQSEELQADANGGVYNIMVFGFLFFLFWGELSA